MRNAQAQISVGLEQCPCNFKIRSGLLTKIYHKYE